MIEIRSSEMDEPIRAKRAIILLEEVEGRDEDEAQCLIQGNWSPGGLESAVKHIAMSAAKAAAEMLVGFLHDEGSSGRNLN